MSMAIIILCVFDTVFPLIMAMVLSALIKDGSIRSFAAYNALLSGCLVVFIDLGWGITVMPGWETTVVYTAIAFMLAFFTGFIAGGICWKIRQKLRSRLQVENKWDVIRKIYDY